MRISRKRNLSARRLWLGPVVLLSSLLLVLAGCSSGGETSVEAVARQFAAAINSGNAAAAANLTDNPAAARPVIEQMLEGLPAQEVRFELEQAASTGGGSGIVSLRAKWDFGKNRIWSYTTDGSMTQLSIGWRLTWAPNLLAPNFQPGQRLDLIRTDAAPPKVLDAAGGPYMAEQIVNQVRIDASATPDLADSARRLANVIVPVAPLVTEQVLVDRASAAPTGPVDAVALRDPDYAILSDALLAIPGVSVTQVPKLVLDNPNLASPVTADIARRWQATRDQTAGWAVTMTGPDGVPNHVAGFQGPPPPDLGVNIDPHVQLAAVNGVVGVGQPAALVVFRPSSGQVLAVAQNSQADVAGQVALQRLDPPGAIFSAFLRVGGVDPRNADGVVKAARQLGIGVDLPLPGFTATAGKFDPGPVTSAYGMAVAASTIATGTLPSPALFTGDAGAPHGATEVLPGQLRDQYRRLMIDSVATGALTVLRAHPGLDALTGQVETDAENPPSWLIGISGDIAFAVFVGATDGTSNAVIVTDQFLRALERPMPQ